MNLIGLGYLFVIGIPTAIPMPSNLIQPLHGAAYVFSGPAAYSGLVEWSATQDMASEIIISEDGKALTPANAWFSQIIAEGAGAYTHRPGRLIFSASDNSDPRLNGRSYVLHTRMRLDGEAVLSVVAMSLVVGGIAWGRRLVRREDQRRNASAITEAVRRGAVLMSGGIAAILVAYLLEDHLWSAMIWLVTGFILTLAVLSLRQFLIAQSLARERMDDWDGLTNVSVIIVSVTVAFTAAEIGLYWYAGAPTPVVDGIYTDRETHTGRIIQTGETAVSLPGMLIAEMAARQRHFLLPEQWHLRPLPPIDGTPAYLWHDVVHVLDARGFRRLNGAFPAKVAGRPRIVVVGDSLTYGEGIAINHTYPRVIADILRREHEVEVLNLGVRGAQSEDILLTTIWALDQLQPDLVVYGMCLNDFLPSGVGQTSRGPVWPIPARYQSWVLRKTRSARILWTGYQKLAIRLHLLSNFHDDLLHGNHQFRSRFANDMVMINRSVTARELPSVLATVLDIDSVTGGPGQQLAEIAEAAMRQAGMVVIPSAEFYTRHEGRAFQVSPWEGHPNEEANAIFATRIADVIRREGLLFPPR